MTYGSNPTCHLFLYNLRAKSRFHILNDWKNRTFHDTLKLYEIQTIMPINKVLLEHSQPLTYCLKLLLYHNSRLEYDKDYI